MSVGSELLGVSSEKIRSQASGSVSAILDTVGESHPLLREKLIKVLKDEGSSGKDISDMVSVLERVSNISMSAYKTFSEEQEREALLGKFIDFTIRGMGCND